MSKETEPFLPGLSPEEINSSIPKAKPEPEKKTIIDDNDEYGAKEGCAQCEIEGGVGCYRHRKIR